jgi:hypothetical protein
MYVSSFRIRICTIFDPLYTVISLDWLRVLPQPKTSAYYLSVNTAFLLIDVITWDITNVKMKEQAVT